MKEDQKKILTAAAFLIAAGLVFGMTRSRSGIQKLDESGAVVMSGSLDADGNISWEKTALQKATVCRRGILEAVPRNRRFRNHSGMKMAVYRRKYRGDAGICGKL